MSALVPLRKTRSTTTAALNKWKNKFSWQTRIYNFMKLFNWIVKSERNSNWKWWSKVKGNSRKHGHWFVYNSHWLLNNNNNNKDYYILKQMVIVCGNTVSFLIFFSTKMPLFLSCIQHWKVQRVKCPPPLFSNSIALFLKRGFRFLIMSAFQ